MKRTLEGITVAGFVVAFWAFIFSLYTGSLILQTIFEWLLLFSALVLIMLLDRAFEYFTIKREQRLNEKEQ